VVVDSKRRAAMRRPIERPDRLMTRANDILAGGEDWTSERAGWMSAELGLFSRSRARKFGDRRAETECGRGRDCGCWRRPDGFGQRNDIAQLGQASAGDRGKIGKLGRFRKALAIARFSARR
jgi:hypothetical protein